MTGRLALILSVLALAGHARAQAPALSRFTGPEIGAAVHLRLTPGEGYDPYFSTPLAVLAAPVGWLVLEAGMDGLFGDTERSAFGLIRGRLLRCGTVALGLASGLQWTERGRWRAYPSERRWAIVEPYWSIPLEASLERRAAIGLTIRPYLGATLPFRTGTCTVDGPEYDQPKQTARGSVCRFPATLYFGVSFGFSLRFTAKADR